MNPKAAKKNLIIVIILFLVGFVFNYFAPNKFKIDGNKIVEIGFMNSVFWANVIASISMGLFVSGFYCAWKLIGILWQRLLQKSTYIWFVSPLWIFIGKFTKFIIAGQVAIILGLPIIIYSIYCTRKMKQASD